MPDFASVHELAVHYGFPFKLRPDQISRVEFCYGYERSALFDDAGTGKTAVSTAVCLAWEQDVNIVLAPPILGRQWQRWLEGLTNAGKVVRYNGTPAQREKLPVEEAKWIITTIQTFKRDWDKLFMKLAKKKSALVVDEATSIANSKSDNFSAVQSWAGLGNKLILVTATPVNHPAQAYSYIKLKTPDIYRSYYHYEQCHVTERDFRDQPVVWDGLDLIRKRLMTQAIRTLKEDVLDLHRPNFITTMYELDKQHMKLYNKLMDELLLELPEDKVIDATNGASLFHAAQQIVSNWAHFSGDPTKRPALFDIIDEVIAEVNNSDVISGRPVSKLIIFTYYKMTSKAVLAYIKDVLKIDAVACYSEVSSKQQEKNIDRFLADPSCRILVGQPQSVGYGLNPQAVCWEVLFAETPTNPMHFRQAMERIYRDGQKHIPNIRIPYAEGTVQVSLHERLLANDDMASYLQGAHKTLRQAIHGAAKDT